MDQRNIFSSDLHLTDVKLRANNSELRQIKQMLLSGNKEKITDAVGKVLSQINDSESAIEMITSDISEFLCDAMLPFDPYVSGTIYTCLGIMTRYKYFFTHNHSSFALETVIRGLNFIIKSGGHDSSVRQPLSVILLIVQGYASFDVMPEKKPFENLLNLVLILLRRKPVSQEVKYRGGLIIKSLFEIESWKLNYPQNLMEVCGKWFDLICVKGESCHSYKEQLTSLGCFLSEKALRYLTKDGHTTPLSVNAVDSEKKSQTGMAGNIITFLVDIVSPEIEEVLTLGEKQGGETMEAFFASLTYIFSETFGERSQMAQRLTEIGLIQIINTILSRHHFRQREKLGESCVVVLTEILLSLSDDVFHLTEMWPSGRNYFRRELSLGMSLLPLDASQWLDKLSDNEVNRSSRLALIIYFYFYLLTAKSTSTDFIYPSAIKLLDLSTEIISTRLIVKAVWFIFVMSQISQDQASPEKNIWATKKMVEILESQTEFSLIYTHHPALLYWTFSSSRISCKIQCRVVKLWLENRSSDCTVLDDLMKKSADIRLTLFQLLQDETPDHVAQLAFSSLKNFMIHSDDNSLPSNIWFLLPQILAKYVIAASAGVKIDRIVELATLKVPLRPDISKILRIAMLLPEALHKSDILPLSSALKLALQLLQISLGYEDNRVVFAFLRCEDFTARIINNITCDITETALWSLAIVSILWSMKFPGDRLPCCYKSINLDFRRMLEILNVNDAEVVKAGLLLLEQMLTTQFKSVLLRVQGLSPESTKMLLFRLEKVLLKYLPVVSVPAWKCLQHCVEQDIAVTDDCFLHEVIKYGLPQLKESREMADFLIVWMGVKRDREPFYDGSRRINSNYFLQTIEQVALFLARNNFQHWPRLCRKVLECCKHFSVDTRLEPYKWIVDRMEIRH